MHRCPPPSSLIVPAGRDMRTGRGRRRVAVLLNCQAKQVDAELLASLRSLVGEEHVFASSSLDEAEAMARKVVHGRYDVVACGGGDGTLCGTLNRLRRYVGEANAWRQAARSHARPRVAAWHMPTLAFLALGTGNAMRSVVGNGSLTSDVTRLLYDDQLAIRRLPLISMPNGELFFFGGMGLDSLLLRDYQAFIADHPLPALRSLLGYIAAVACRTLPRVCRGEPLLRARVASVGRAWYISPRAGDRAVALGHDVPLFAGEASLLAVGTIPYFGYGLRAFPFADVVPNTMHLRIISMSAPLVLSALPQLWRGTLRDPQGVRDFAAEGVTIELDAPFAFEHSGDAQGDFSQLTLTVAPDSLHLVQFAPSAAPALRAG